MPEERKKSFRERYGGVASRYSQITLRALGGTTARLVFMAVGLLVAVWVLVVQVGGILQDETPLPEAVSARNPEIRVEALDLINGGREQRAQYSWQSFDSARRFFGFSE